MTPARCWSWQTLRSLPLGGLPWRGHGSEEASVALAPLSVVGLSLAEPAHHLPSGLAVLVMVGGELGLAPTKVGLMGRASDPTQSLWGRSLMGGGRNFLHPPTFLHPCWL